MNHTNENLLYAVQTGKIAEVRKSLEDKANPNYSEGGDYTALHWAAQEGFCEIARLLVEFGANPNAVDETGSTPLYNSAAQNLEMSRTLIELGADANAFPHAPLHNAVAWDEVEITRLLLENGADPNLANDEGQTALFYVLPKTDSDDDENIETAKLLISHGADAKVKDNQGRTAADAIREMRDDSAARYNAVLKILE